MKIAVIGAGASGLMAALTAAWQGAAVSLFERNNTLGRKLLVTGSGRCNLTNDQVSQNPYTCADLTWTAALLEKFGVKPLLEILQALGIPTYKTWDGWYYPLSNSAHSVVSAMTHAIHSAGFNPRLSCSVTDIIKVDQGFRLAFLNNRNPQSEVFERIIVASGGKALLPIQPALAPVRAELGALKQLQGVRLDLGVTLIHGKKVIASSAGNMIFTEWGLNGPAVMDISHHISNTTNETSWLSLDLLHFIEADFYNLLDLKRRDRFPVSLLLSAFFPPKVVECYIHLAGFERDTLLCTLDDTSVKALLKLLKNSQLKVEGVRGYQFCQASAGGVPVSEVSPITLESQVHKGLHLTGETLDVIGPCGGYNLHFAFASGALAGQAAGQTQPYEKK